MWCRYMYKGYADSCAARGQYWIRKTLLDLYKPTADMFPGSPSIFTFRSPHILLICMYVCMYLNVIGDEDNGEMSAWYVLSSIGLYALSPGSDAYTIGAPLFERVEIDISSLSGSGDNSPYIQYIPIK